MSVNTQVSGTKQLNIQPSKNLGTVINTEVSGNHIKGVHEYKKITDVQPTQVSGEVHNTNYLGVNDEGMDIRAAKKITGNELNVQTFPTADDAKAKFIEDANKEIAKQEADKKSKGFADLIAIEITTPPTKTEYVEGQDFDSTGMVVKADYDDGSSKFVSDFEIVGGEDLELGTTSVQVVFAQGSVEKTATQEITVIEKAVASIAITTAPTKVSYILGETFDPTGMVVTATYNDETEEVVEDYTYSPTTALTADDTTITVSFESKTATQAITVISEPSWALAFNITVDTVTASDNGTPFVQVYGDTAGFTTAVKFVVNNYSSVDTLTATVLSTSDSEDILAGASQAFELETGEAASYYSTATAVLEVFSFGFATPNAES